MNHRTVAPPALPGFVVPSLIEEARLAFPSADLVSAAAGMFPPAHDVQRRPFEKVLSSTWSESAAGWREGRFPVLEVGPGMVAFRRRDAAAVDRARDRERAAGDREYRRRSQDAGAIALSAEGRRLRLENLLRTPMWKNPLFDSIDGAEVVARYRAGITEWSRKSQANLIKTILSLDLAGLVAGGRAPAMVTLTLPDRWLEVAPDGAAARRVFDRFRRRWARQWGAPSWIWKREFQERGAPHWHLWVVPPTDDLRAFKSWLSENWTASLGISDLVEAGKSRRRGTHVSLAEGMRARDPKRLAIYFLKESGPVAVKAYQNAVPAEWAGEVVGRFWGVAGVDKKVATVELDPAVMDHVWRILRRVRVRSAGIRKVTVERINQATGVVRRRKVNRRFKVRQTAGWVAVNDGPAFAAGIARYLESLSPPPPPD